MNKNLNKTALVTGAGTGIGKSICLQLQQQGMRIIAVSRNTNHLKEIETALNDEQHIMLNVDLISSIGKLTLLTTLQQYGMPHVVICNLNSGSERKQLINLSTQINENALAENISHLFTIMPEVLKFQREQGFGRWIGISSMSPHLGVPGMAIYNMQKGIMENCFRTMATEEGRQGITANIIAPGLIATPTVLNNYTPDELEKREKENVLHRIGTPEEVAAAVGFFASPQAGFITGVTLPVNGGNHLAWQYLI